MKSPFKTVHLVNLLMNNTDLQRMNNYANMPLEFASAFLQIWNLEKATTQTEVVPKKGGCFLSPYLICLGHNNDLTKTRNYAWKVSGTQGI